ncbi:MAG: glycosyltransferase family 1 protein [Planctomycetes bacterium]|nr:glycosyltransferase family 1 protein [Planctomycetota bacterium]
MSSDIRIDFVAPPFAGHLYPALDLARRLRDRGVGRIRFLTTAGGRCPVESAGFPFVEILPGQDQAVWAIANTRLKVGSNPLQMWRQVERNLSLMHDLQNQVRETWLADRPDLVITDFAVPIAGLTAQAMGIRWWTGMPSPCVLETMDGTPAYLGGWRPRSGLYGRLRDWLGRQTVRTFKQASRWLFTRSLRSLSISNLYRADGSEVVYSPERILVYGMREFEFERTWPGSCRFIGPLTVGPSLPSPALQWDDSKKTVLVTLGTHLPWAKSAAIDLIQQVARLMPETVFHFSRGQMGNCDVDIRDNLHIYGSVPYDTTLHRYDAAIIHGGTGIVYSCIQQGVPMLVWPHDYDQFDHAARIVHHQLGLQMVPNPPRIAADLKTLGASDSIRSSLDLFRKQSATYDPASSVLQELKSIVSCE